MKFNIDINEKYFIGVYVISNIVNNKKYIGSTGNSFYHRYHQHVSDYKNGKHNGVALKRAFDKYGIDNFIFSIVCVCEEKERLKLEQLYIDKGTDYNSCKTAGSLLGYKHPNTSKTKTIIGGLHHSSKCVYQFSLNGFFIKKHSSLIEALKSFGKTKNGSSHITQSCIGKTFSAFGYRWSFTNKPSERQNRLGKHLIKISNETFEKEFLSHGQAVKFFNEIGFAKVKQGAISNALRNKNKLYNYKLEKICATS